MVPYSFNAPQLKGWPEYFEKAVKMEVGVVIVSPAKHGRHIEIRSRSTSSSSALSFFWFPIDNSRSDAYISFKLYRRVKHH